MDAEAARLQAEQASRQAEQARWQAGWQAMQARWQATQQDLQQVRQRACPGCPTAAEGQACTRMRQPLLSLCVSPQMEQDYNTVCGAGRIAATLHAEGKLAVLGLLDKNLGG